MLIGRNLLIRLPCREWSAPSRRQSFGRAHALRGVNTNTDTMGEEISFVFESEENRSHYRLEPKVGTRPSECFRIHFKARGSGSTLRRRYQVNCVRATVHLHTQNQKPTKPFTSDISQSEGSIISCCSDYQCSNGPPCPHLTTLHGMRDCSSQLAARNKPCKQRDKA